MSRSEELKSSIEKNLNKMISESNICFDNITLPLTELLEPTEGLTPPNPFMLYCKDRASLINNEPGDNSNLLLQRWDKESSEIKMVYSTLSDVMSTAYKEVFPDSMPYLRLIQNILNRGGGNIENTQHNDIQQNQERPFINEYYSA